MKKDEKHLITCQCRGCQPEKPIWYPNIVWRESDLEAIEKLLDSNFQDKLRHDPTRNN